MNRSLTLVVLLVACAQDSSFTAIKDPEPPIEDTSAPPLEVDEAVVPEVNEECPELVYGAQLLNVDESCKNDPPPTTRYTPVVEWQWETYPHEPYVRSSWNAPLVGQMTDDNGDGAITPDDTPDIVVTTTNLSGEAGVEQGRAALRLISGDGSVEHWARTSWALDGETWVPDGYMSPAIGDTDADGHPEIYTMVHRGVSTDSTTWAACRMARFSADGELVVLSPQDLECRPHAPALADMTGNGDIEVIAGTFVLSSDDLTVEAAPVANEYLGTGYSASYWNGPIPAVVDLDDDGQMEIITGRHIQEADGSVRCYTDESDAWSAAADLDGDGYGEVVLTGDYRVTILDRECRFVAAWPIDDEGRGGPATIADYDGDGTPEIGIAAASHYLVYETDGTLRWSWLVTDQSSNCTGSSVFDLEGDGYAEVLYADEYSVWVLSGYFGVPLLQWTGHRSGTSNEYPVIVDVDGDGASEIVAVGDRGMYVIGSEEGWQPSRQVWNQHTYNITNVNDDLTIPSPTPANWPEFNSFRSADLRANFGQGAKLPDAVSLVADICELECDENKVLVTVKLGNEGLGDLLEGGSVAVYALAEDGTRTLLEVIATEDLVLSGYSTVGTTLTLSLDDLPTRSLVVVADDDGTGVGIIEECDEDNNALVIEDICADADE
ncbi:MAG TPA: hypothetical protein DFR83_01330 [Deltaproteobacteria bacterium]|nr:hypothetical protein [Deltaproteobacteria bacterium]